MARRRKEAAIPANERISVRVPEAARLIGICKSKLYELIASGEIESAKIGRVRVIMVDSLRAYVASKYGRQL